MSKSKIESTKMKINPAKKPSITSLSTIFLMYNMPKNPITIIIIIGMIIWKFERFFVKIGLIILVNI